MIVQEIVYTQDDLDKPSRFVGVVASTLNALIRQINGTNPVELVDAVSFNDAVAFKNGKLTESDIQARIFKAERPVA